MGSLLFILRMDWTEGTLRDAYACMYVRVYVSECVCMYVICYGVAYVVPYVCVA